MSNEDSTCIHKYPQIGNFLTCNTSIQILRSLHVMLEVHDCIYMYMFLMRDERMKEASKVKQTNKQGKVTQHTQGSHFFLSEK